MASTNIQPFRFELTNEHLHIWEHAALLHRCFEWQASADAFLYLSRAIDNPFDSNLCLLNAAIILARLGNYDAASCVLSRPGPSPDLRALTFYLLGYIEFERENFEKSEACFGVALRAMDGKPKSFSRLDLHFELTRERIEQYLLALSHLDTAENGDIALDIALPADSIFDSPPTLLALSYSARRTESAIEVLRTVGEALGEEDSKRINSFPKDNEDLHSSQGPFHSQLKKLAVPQPFRKAFHGLARKPSIASRSKMAPTEMVGSVAPQPNRRPALVPRDARVQGDSMQNLTSLIRSLPRQGRVCEPRSAKVQYEPTRELAKFLRLTGPKSSKSAEVPPRNASVNYGQIYGQSPTACEAADHIERRTSVEPPQRFTRRWTTHIQGSLSKQTASDAQVNGDQSLAAMIERLQLSPSAVSTDVVSADYDITLTERNEESELDDDLLPDAGLVESTLSWDQIQIARKRTLGMLEGWDPHAQRLCFGPELTWERDMFAEDLAFNRTTVDSHMIFDHVFHSQNTDSERMH